MANQKLEANFRPMIGLETDHVTPSRPITRLYFMILKVLRGTPYKNISLGFVIYGEKICHLWGVSPYWQIPPTCDKPQSSSVGSQSSLGFVIYGGGICLLYASVMNIYLFIRVAYKRQIPWGFVNYGEKQSTIGVCHIWEKDLSFMGSVPIFLNPTHLWQTPILLSG